MDGKVDQDLVQVASLLHIRFHSLLNYIHRLNGVDYADTQSSGFAADTHAIGYEPVECL